MNESNGERFVFSIRDLIVLVGINGVLFALLLPALGAARSNARRTTCQSNFKNIGLGIQNYHAAHQVMPMHGTGPTNESGDDPILAMQPGTSSPGGYTRHQLSFLVGILPFVEQQNLWDQISSPSIDQSGNHWAAFGPAPYTIAYEPWNTDIAQFRCPSDFGSGAPALGRTNYAACVGDSMWRTDGASWSYFKGSMWRYEGSNRLRSQQVKSSVRGPFVPRRQLSFNDILDGLSDTMLAGEIATHLGDRNVRTIGSQMNGRENVLGNPSFCQGAGQISESATWTSETNLTHPLNSRGARWADFRPVYTQVNTILPPNSEVCLRGNQAQDGVVPPSSRHHGGAHILMADGAVIFITDSIEAGDSHAGVCYYRDKVNQNCVGSMSPFGLWGALGTRSSKESVSSGTG